MNPRQIQEEKQNLLQPHHSHVHYVDISSDAQQKTTTTRSIRKLLNQKNALEQLQKKLKKNLCMRRTLPINLIMLSVMIGSLIYLLKNLLEYHSYQHDVSDYVDQLRHNASALAPELENLRMQADTLRATLDAFKQSFLDKSSEYYKLNYVWNCREFVKSGTCLDVINFDPHSFCFPEIPQPPAPTCVLDLSACDPNQAAILCNLQNSFFDTFPLYEKALNQYNSLAGKLNHLYELIDEWDPSFVQWLGNAGFFTALILGEVSPLLIIMLTLLTSVLNHFKLSTDDKSALSDFNEQHFILEPTKKLTCYDDAQTEIDRQLNKTRDGLKKFSYDSQIAFFMGTHKRVGRDSAVRILKEDSAQSPNVIREIFNML